MNSEMALLFATIGLISLLFIFAEDSSSSEKQHQKALCELLAKQVVSREISLDRYLLTSCTVKNIPLTYRD